MDIPQNYLGVYRKKSTLTQTDIACVMALPDYSSVSRWENGIRKPNIQALLVYHLLFNTKIEDFFIRQKSELVPMLAKKISERIRELQAMDGDSTTPARIAFLQSVFTRLASLPL
jgi:transcriptional regulator with XRE-family HTH domain